MNHYYLDYPIEAGSGREAEYTLDWWLANHRALTTETAGQTSHEYLWTILSVCRTCMLQQCSRKSGRGMLREVCVNVQTHEKLEGALFAAAEVGVDGAERPMTAALRLTLFKFTSPPRRFCFCHHLFLDVGQT